MEQEIEQLKMLVENLFSKIESLEERIEILEDEKASQPKGPEPILTCVQCLAEYKESENAEGYCKYHTGTLKYNFSTTSLSCCNKNARSLEDIQGVIGCTKGKHYSRHHTKYFYTTYFIYMRDLSNEAQELWLEMDICDYVTNSCEWAEVGLTKKGNIFVVAGPSRITPAVCAEFSPKELTKCKSTSLVVFEKSDAAGWYLKAKLLASGSTAQAITVTLKSAWSSVPYSKKVNLILEENAIKCGTIEVLSDPRPEEPTVTYTLPEGSKSGPMLEAGEDYSVGRKKDYPTKTNDDIFKLELKQLGDTSVTSDTWGLKHEKWTNFFSTAIKIINGSLEIISIVDVLGHYQNKEGEWVKCDEIIVGLNLLKQKNDIFEMRDFLIDGAAPMTITVRLGIEFQDRPPNGYRESEQAHHLLPQPLLLRITLVDKEERTASLIFEQGNRPLPLATYEKRQKNWGKKFPLLFYLYADDADLRQRSDVALYYNSDGILCYRPAPNDNGGQVYYVRRDILEVAAYKAKKSGVKEQELKSFYKENTGSKIEAFAIVDLDNQFTFALKVVITTPTSFATDYCLLPRNDFSQATLTIEQIEVEVNSDFTVSWRGLPCVCKTDMIKIFNRFGKDHISSVGNREEKTEGSVKMKAPGSPGVYEVRYYPKCLQGSNTGLRHSISAAAATFKVITA